MPESPGQQALEKRFFALMAVTEEQQTTVDLQQQTLNRLLETTQAMQQHVQTVMQNQCAEQARQHAGFLQDQHQLFSQHHAKLSRLVNWKHLLMAAGITLIPCVLIVLGAAWYLHALNQKIIRAEEALQGLKLLNADVTSCLNDGERLPCVRVRTDLGGFGPDRNYRVIDQ